MVKHSESINRSVQVVNLDPAAEHFNYPVMAGEYTPLHFIYTKQTEVEEETQACSVSTNFYWAKKLLWV